MFTSGEEFSSNDCRHAQTKGNTSECEHFPYEELEPNVRTLTCPTCGGSGRLTQEQEHDLVALIPVRDKRLKPRRTVLYLIIAVTLCLAISAVVIALLFPRDVTLKLLKTVPVNITIKKSNLTIPFIVIKNTLQINNSNFYEVTISNLGQEVTWDEHIVVADVGFNGSVTVPAHSVIKYDVYVKTVYQGTEGQKVRRVCCSFLSYNMLLVIDTSAQASGLTLSQQLSNRVFKFIDCGYSFPAYWENCFNII